MGKLASQPSIRMRPVRRDLGQRPHDEQAFGGAGMRQDQAVQVALLPPVGDQVEIKGPRRVQGAAHSTEGVLDPAQRGHGFVRIVIGADQHHAIQKRRILRVRPGGRAPPGRPGDDV